MNGTEAARRAGYKGNDNTLATVAAENLRKPAIRQEIDRRMALLMSNAKITVEKVLRDLEVTRVKALLDCNYSAAVRCLELQGKYLKMFSDRIEHVQAIEDISTEELVNLIKELVKAGDIDLLDLMAQETRCALIGYYSAPHWTQLRTISKEVWMFAMDSRLSIAIT